MQTLQIFSVFLLVFIAGAKQSYSYEINLTPANVNTSYTGIANNSLQTVYQFRIDSSFIYENDSYLSAEVSSTGSNQSKKCPVHFVIRLGHHVRIIDLPKEYHPENLTLYSGARTLCIDPATSVKGNVNIFVTVSTCNSENIDFSLKLSLKHGFFVVLDAKETHTEASSSSPAFFHFNFPEDEKLEYVKILANSTTTTRTFLSIQEPKCPVNDELPNIKSKGRWVSMSQLTAITVQKKDFPDGFFILFLPDEIDDLSCKENITFQIVEGTQTNPLALILPLGFYVLAILLVYLGYSYSHQLYIRGTRDVRREWAPCCGGIPYDLTPLRVEDMTNDTNLYKYLTEHSYRYFWTMLSIAIFYGLPVTLIVVNLAQLVKVSGNMDTCNFNYFCSHPFWRFVNFNNIYSNFGHLLLGTVFMILVHKRATRLKVNDVSLQRQAENNTSWSFRVICSFSTVNLTPTGYGAYQNFGIYYTLGFAMMMTGTFNALYNMCPHRDTAFFATSFNYVTILLSQIKIYNLRHPCVITDNFTYGSIATVLTTLAAGYLVDNHTFQILVSIFLSFIVQLAILILSSGGYAKQPPNVSQAEDSLQGPIDQVTTSFLGNAVPDTAIQGRRNRTEPAGTDKITSLSSLFLNIFRDCNIRDLFVPNAPFRIFWPVLRLLLNIGILFFVWVQMAYNHFTTKMFILFLSNFLFDFIYYFVIMKCSYKEYNQKISFQPVIYLILAIVSWAVSFFLMTKSFLDWELPEILLREHYKDCIDPFGYYDFSDLYRLTSAPAWFFTFMVMLTADDALSRVSCEMTPVF